MDLDNRILDAINEFARNTPWLHPIVSGYANYGSAVFAALMLVGWWIARRESDPAALVVLRWLLRVLDGTPLRVLLASGERPGTGTRTP